MCLKLILGNLGPMTGIIILDYPIIIGEHDLYKAVQCSSHWSMKCLTGPVDPTHATSYTLIELPLAYTVPC